jgi:hypothetical protein
MVMSVAIEQPGSYNWILWVYGKLGMKQLVLPIFHHWKVEK